MTGLASGTSEPPALVHSRRRSRLAIGLVLTASFVVLADV
jgi:hypothetical protein